MHDQFLEMAKAGKALPMSHVVAAISIAAGYFVHRQFDQRRRRRVMNAPFSFETSRRLLLLTLRDRIPQSQIYPFHYYSQKLLTNFDAEVREVNLEDYLSTDSHEQIRGATTVLFQSQFDLTQERIDHIMAVIRHRNPDAKIVYGDWFAPTDLQLAKHLDQHVSFYVKKHVLKDFAQYDRPTVGDTNLMDHYCRKFEIEKEEKHFVIPEGFSKKLVIGPSFATADFMLRAFRSAAPPEMDRPIDLHARIAVRGTDWYERMRGEAAAAVNALGHLTVRTGVGIRHAHYLAELRHSKICFSPFGYGEVCWRDYEAAMSGAVILKPDMSHIRTDPDIFVPHETYMPVKWDLSDLGERVAELLASPDLRNTLARNAFNRLGSFIKDGGFVRQIAPIL